MPRYCTAMSSTSGGVCSASMIWRQKASPNAASRMLTARKVRKAVDTASFILLYSFAPKCLLTMTEAPTPPPTAMQMKTLVRA